VTTNGMLFTQYELFIVGGLICKGWKSRYFVLFEDSSLIWYHDHNSYHHVGGVKLKVISPQ